MIRKYSATHKIKFTNISEAYDVSRSVKSVLGDLHSSVITYVVKHFDGTLAYKQRVVNVLNILTYALYASEPLPMNWRKDSPLDNVPDIDDDDIQEILGDVYLTVDAIDWDISPVDVPSTTPMTPVSATVTSNVGKFSLVVSGTNSVPSTKIKSESVILDTPATDLYIQAPEIPQFDINKPWLQKQCGSDLLTIYTTLPEIPQRQRDISITTDVNKMSDTDLLKLYPNHFIRTRAKIMYVPQTNMDFDPEYGVILPIDDYSNDQIIDNYIKYPHIYKLARHLPGLQAGTDFPSFYGWMEVNGELIDIQQNWDSLEISKWIPMQVDFIKEYLVRKYLMDAEYKGTTYKYPIFGTLDPYLTLFMPASKYADLGYDVVDLARKCVMSRVSYKQSRSPILRRINESA